ncbi:MAG: CGNR zinc finger domain-containing protein [Actinomycetota bacterium]|nr:CGNR zinc finger domain-containing protein [Actinomycetota bacterium]
MDVQELTRQVEGKPAPVPLLALQAFANTLDVETSTDLLDSPESFEDWLSRSGFAKKGLKVDPQALRRARRLRATVRELLIANERGTRNRKAEAALARLASTSQASLAADDEGRLGPDLAPLASAEELIGRLLTVILYAQATGTWERLKLCENPECLWAFYDSSRNRSGSWCRSGLCGNRLKNRAYRDRQRSL